MESNVGRVRPEGAVPPQVVRRVAREHRQGERRDFARELEERAGGEAAAPAASPEPPVRREPDRDVGDDHVDVTA